MEDFTKKRLMKILSSKRFQRLADFCRVMLVLLLFITLFVLISEIEAVKLLNYDVCEICMNKTGAICFKSP